MISSPPPSHSPPTKASPSFSHLCCMLTVSCFLSFSCHLLKRLSTHLKKMGSIQRQESFDNDDLYLPDNLLEAPTLSSKEMKRAREEALYVLKTKSPEEAFKIFIQGLEYKVDNPLGPRADGQAETVRPPTTGNDGPKTTVPLPKN